MRLGQFSARELEDKIRAGGREGEIYGRLDGLAKSYAEDLRRQYPRIPRRVSGYNRDEPSAPFCIDWTLAVLD